MWWLLIPAGIGFFVGLLKGVTEQEFEAAKRWNTQQRDVKDRIEKKREEIERALKDAYISFDFQYLVGLHFDSVRTSDIAYELLIDAKQSVNTLRRLIKAIDERIEQIRLERSYTSEQKKKVEIFKEIISLKEQREMFYNELKTLRDQQLHFSHEVKKLNAITRSLKVAIRDGCGSRGKEWYDRLEQRTAIKRKKIASN